jgi:hypothetical protein
MKKFAEPVKKEQPSLYCVGCRQWIVTRETHNMFSKVDGVSQRVIAWKCPACRGETDAVIEVARGPVTGADVSKDERLGPYRAVKRNTVKVNPSGKTARADLECGHNICIVPDATTARCRKCVAKKPKAAKEESK